MNKGKSAPMPRTPLHVGVQFKRNYARKASPGVLKNISLTGAFLKQPECEFVAGEKIVVSFNVGNRERSITSKVVWKNQYGCGLKFEHFNNRDRQIIDDLIYFIETKRENVRNVFEKIIDRMDEEAA